MRTALITGILLVGLASLDIQAFGTEPAKEMPLISANLSASLPAVDGRDLGVDVLAFADLKTRWQSAVSILEAELAKAKADYEMAKIMKQEYVDGTYVLQKQTAEYEYFTTREQARQAQVDLGLLKATADREKVPARELEEKEFALSQAEMQKQIAETKLRILETFKKPRAVAQLDNDILFAEKRLKILELRYRIALEGLKQVEAQASPAKPVIESPGAAAVDK